MLSSLNRIGLHVSRVSCYRSFLNMKVCVNCIDSLISLPTPIQIVYEFFLWPNLFSYCKKFNFELPVEDDVVFVASPEYPKPNSEKSFLVSGLSETSAVVSLSSRSLLAKRSLESVLFPNFFCSKGVSTFRAQYTQICQEVRSFLRIFEIKTQRPQDVSGLTFILNHITLVLLVSDVF